MWRGLTFLLPFLFFGQVSVRPSLYGPARAQSRGRERVVPCSGCAGVLDITRCLQAAVAK